MNNSTRGIHPDFYGTHNKAVVIAARRQARRVNRRISNSDWDEPCSGATTKGILAKTPNARGLSRDFLCLPSRKKDDDTLFSYSYPTLEGFKKGKSASNRCPADETSTHQQEFVAGLLAGLDKQIIIQATRLLNLPNGIADKLINSVEQFKAKFFDPLIQSCSRSNDETTNSLRQSVLSKLKEISNHHVSANLSRETGIQNLKQKQVRRLFELWSNKGTIESRLQAS